MEVDEGPTAPVKRTADESEPQDAAPKKSKTVSVFSTDLLRVYYARLFPYDQMFQWLSYGNDPAKAKENEAIDKEYFYKREISFTLENDIYIRFLSFRNVEEMKAEIQKKQPHKIDIGAVYSVSPRNHSTVKSTAIKPLERELVFDIDLTDYDDVRVGCTPDMMWEKQSWLYMSVAIRIIDRALREDFGFEHLLWVFSGRRGVHCWVCDSRARALEDRERTAVVQYLTLITGSDGGKAALSSPLHPSIQRALPMLEDVFERMVCGTDGQDLLADEKRWERVLAFIPDETIQERLRNAWQSEPDSTSLKRWKQLRATVRDAAKKQKGMAAQALRNALHTIIIVHTYPRLDVNVSTHRNHLLKSPFVVHPKTGKVCVPILDVENCDSFDPDGVPTLATLVDELDSRKRIDDESTMDVIRSTGMGPYVEGFEKSFLKPLYRAIRQEFHDANEKRAAETADW